MPLYNEDGNEVEGALTPEEVQAQIDAKTEEKAEEIKKQIDEIQEESNTKIAGLEEQLKEKEELLTKASDKDVNFKKLRESKEDLEKRLEEERKKTSEEIAGIKSQLEGDKVVSAIKAIIGNDQEKVDKAKFHFDHLKPNEEDKEDFKNRIKRAVFLATGFEPKNLLNGDILSTGGGTPPGMTPGGRGKISEGAKEVGHKLGLSDDEMKKAGIL